MTTIIMANTIAGPCLAPHLMGQFLENCLAKLSVWRILGAILIIFAAYDQRKSMSSPGYNIRIADLA